MSIKIGERIPNATLQVLRDGVESISTEEVFQHRKVLLFSVPGAFTPTCTEQHLPGYVCRYDQFAKRNISIACLSVNDAYVMHAWASAQQVPDGILMLADGNGSFATALGLAMDASAFGMGLRARRFALYAEDAVVKLLEVDAPGEFKVSSAEAMLAALDGLE